MSLSRPLSKELLKRMFLKVLYEHRKGGSRESTSSDFNGIIRYGIPEIFGLSQLDEEEIAFAHRGVFELERDGYIMQNHTQSSSSFKVLTKRGKELVKSEIEDMKISSVDIDQFIDNENLIRKIHDDFIESDYETAIFKSFRLVEESVRKKSELSADVIGTNLMSKAFHPTKGILNYSLAETEGEKEAFHLLMKSAIMMFKNPSSHRTVGYNNENEAAQVIGFANLLLGMLDKCKNNNK